MKAIPEKYNTQEIELKWAHEWPTSGIYKYNPNKSKQETYVIDTPPPTVSGSLHVGHAFSYTQTDIIARFKRMQGLNVFYPIGWDDNGLPTERRVQNIFGIKCSTQVPYQTNWKPTLADAKNKTQVEVARQNFLEACHIQAQDDEKKYKELWQNLGLSIDWTQQYETINDHCRKVSQLSFLDLIAKKQAYNLESPTMWDTEFQTAIAQAEVEEREVDGHFHDIEFKTENNETFIISTTRPELLAACIAVVAHPDDARYQHLFGKYAITPLYNVKVPILPATHAEPEKGTGILMVCTFGDIHDVEFWKKSSLPLRQIISRAGTMSDIEFGTGVFESLNPSLANQNYQAIKNLFIKQAKKVVADQLKELGVLKGDLKPTKQFVKHYEKGQFPLQYVSTRQWFIKILDHKSELIEQGKKIAWYPEHMFKRYEQWVEGLNQDWCISRQRYFGVPFPVWYKLDSNLEPDYSNPIFATKEMLPVDPQMHTAPGFKEDQRNKPNGFTGDPDVMDTWATSSVTPQISSHWGTDSDRHQKLFPADLRPQGHEIIRTWAFYTIAKAYLHEKTIPWKSIAISGWVVNPDRKKMSKSKGNTVTPEDLIVEYSADAIRYWAAKAKLGQDTIYSEEVFKIGKRLTTKLFNMARFVHLQIAEEKNICSSQITEAVDLSFMLKLNELIKGATENFSNYNYANVLADTESLFWSFCDDYIELTKARAYQQKDSTGGKSAIATLYFSLQTFIKLLAPIIPFITEEIWSWRYADETKCASIHHASWPKQIELKHNSTAEIFDCASILISKARSEKTVKQKSLKTAITHFIVKGKEEDLKIVSMIENDLKLSCSILSNIEKINLSESDERFVTEITLQDS